MRRGDKVRSRVNRALRGTLLRKRFDDDPAVDNFLYMVAYVDPRTGESHEREFHHSEMELDTEVATVDAVVA